MKGIDDVSDERCLWGRMKVLPWVAEQSDEEIEKVIRLEADGLVRDMLEEVPRWREELAGA